MIKGRDLRRAVVNWLLVIALVVVLYGGFWLFVYDALPLFIMMGK